MAKIFISNSFPTQPIARQIPVRHASWCRHHQFQIADGVTTFSSDPIDAWIICDNLLEHETRMCHRDRTALITYEPKSVRRYRSAFVSQFGHVRTSHESIQRPQVTHDHEAQIWYYGKQPCQSHDCILDYDALASLQPPKKSKLLSVIASNKVVTEDHRQRLRFVEQLKAAFGDQIDVFGRGIRDVDDKADAIWNYQYHIVLENDHSPLYLSEKLPDAFLGWSFPLYSGGSYADRVFPEGSFGRVDMYDHETSIETIRRLIQANAYAAQLSSIAESRRIVLDELNLFAVITKMVDAWGQPQGARKPSALTLLPKKRSVRLTMHQWLRKMALAA